MKHILYILTFFIALTSCKSIECKYNANRAAKLQSRSVKHINKLLEMGCSFDIDSTLKSRTINIHRDTVVEVKEKKVLVEVPSDALIWEQTVRCDSLGRVVLDMERRLKKKPKLIKGDVRIVDNVITIECKYDSLLHEIAIKDTTILNLTSQIETLNNKEVNLIEQPKQTFWEGFKPFAWWVLAMFLLAFGWWITNKTIFKNK